MRGTMFGERERRGDGIVRRRVWLGMTKSSVTSLLCGVDDMEPVHPTRSTRCNHHTHTHTHTHTCDEHDAACGVMIVGHVVRPSCRVAAVAMSLLHVRSSQTLHLIYF